MAAEHSTEEHQELGNETARDPKSAGWKRDPWGRHAGRYWDGSRWTHHVMSAERVPATDPVPNDPIPRKSAVPPPPLESSPTESPALYVSDTQPRSPVQADRPYGGSTRASPRQPR